MHMRQEYTQHEAYSRVILRHCFILRMQNCGDLCDNARSFRGGGVSMLSRHVFYQECGSLEIHICMVSIMDVRRVTVLGDPHLFGLFTLFTWITPTESGLQQLPKRICIQTSNVQYALLTILRG